MNKRIAFGFWLLAFGFLTAGAQRVLTLDSCRQMALSNNKQLGISKMKQSVAANIRKSARTKYLPHVSAIGTYEYTSEPISLLSGTQKAEFQHLGTTMSGALAQSLGDLIVQNPNLAAVMGRLGPTMETVMNGLGQKIVDAFDTDTRHLFAGSVMLTQPLFMGGSIIAMNKMADINEQLAENSLDARRQATLYKIDQAYWQVVSLYHKRKLAESYLELVRKLDGDVQKMIDEGVATRSDGLSVDVKVNEAEMAVSQVNDGLVLSRMLLNQLCGLPLNEEVTLKDEQADEIAVVELSPELDVDLAVSNRPELKMLQNTVDLSKQTTNILRAGNLPQLLLTGGYAVSNPNVLDGFQRKFGGFWHVGVMMRIPIWNWGDVMYKVRASKGATSIAKMELEEARDLIELQVNQNTFKVDEANKKLTMALSNIERANENLRMANLGFQEGVITPATVMEAQTAWLQACWSRDYNQLSVHYCNSPFKKLLSSHYSLKFLVYLIFTH